MNAVLSLSHFCETHGPTVLLSTQAFHFAGEVQSGVLEPFGTEFFGCIQKLKDYKAGISPCIDNVRCEACESVSGYITNDHENKISFLSTRLAIDSNVSFLLKQAAVRSLSCEVVPKKEGKVYFGDSVRGHVLSTTFFLKDSQARGFHRLYSIIVFMRDKHFLLNSWPFFQQHINEMISQLQKKAFSVYTEEQNLQSQRALRLSSLDQKHSSARSLVKLTASTNVFAQLHLWFTWLLSTGARRLEEHVPTRGLDCNIKEKKAGEFILVEEYKEETNISNEEAMKHLRQLRKILGDYDFQRLLYSTLIGRQIVIRGHKIIVSLILSLLQIFLPSEKFRCQKFGDSYQSPGVCNIVGVDISAAVPKPSKTILRLDIIPSQEIGTATITNVSAAYKFYNFIVKNESELPEKLPSLLQKIDKAFSDESLSDSVVGLHVKSLIEEWLHVADVVKEAKKKQSHVCFSTLMRYLGVQEQDEKLIHFWSY